MSQFRRTVDERLQSLQRLTGKKATTADVQQISDDLLKAVTLDKAAWWNPFGSDTTKRKFELTVGDIPPAERTQIEQALRNHKHAVTPEAILNLYLSHQQSAGTGR